MNFIAALILMICDDDSLAWNIFAEVMNINDWRRLYMDETPKLLEVVKTIRGYLVKE